jgi:hypothetical protein
LLDNAVSVFSVKDAFSQEDRYGFTCFSGYLAAQNMPVTGRARPQIYTSQQQNFLNNILTDGYVDNLHQLITRSRDQNGWGFAKTSHTLKQTLEEIERFSLSYHIGTNTATFKYVINQQINNFPQAYNAVYDALPFSDKFFRNQFNQPQRAQQNDKMINSLVLQHVVDAFNAIQN